MTMLGFEITFWDYVTFATFMLAGAAAILVYIWLAGLPGRIALARKHPEAEAVKLLGWAGLLPTIYPWMQALIWAFKPTDVVDIRRFPREEAQAIEEDIARLSGKPPAQPANTPDDGNPPLTEASDEAPDEASPPPASGPTG
jgi:hypothetical protein